jgi:quercetin dioxygenase-like cupin family protein
VLEVFVPPGMEVAPHLHRRHSDAFYVLDGELEFLVGDEVVQACVGAYVLSPPGVVHGFRNTGAEPARLLNLHAPGGFAEYLRELGELRAAGIEPDAAFFARHDVFDPD